MSHSIHLANTLSNLNSRAACPLNTNERKQLVIHTSAWANFFHNGFSFIIKLLRKYFLIWLCSSHSNFHSREKLPVVLITTDTKHQCSLIGCIDTDLGRKKCWVWHPVIIAGACSQVKARTSPKTTFFECKSLPKHCSGRVLGHASWDLHSPSEVARWRLPPHTTPLPQPQMMTVKKTN